MVVQVSGLAEGKVIKEASPRLEHHTEAGAGDERIWSRRHRGPHRPGERPRGGCRQPLATSAFIGDWPQGRALEGGRHCSLGLGVEGGGPLTLNGD